MLDISLRIDLVIAIEYEIYGSKNELVNIGWYIAKQSIRYKFYLAIHAIIEKMPGEKIVQVLQDRK